MRRQFTTIALTLAVLAAFVVPAVAGDTVAEKAKGVPAKEALLSSATLAADPAMMKGLAKTLGSDKGILSAKFDGEKDLLRIVFDPKLTSAEAIEKALGAQLKDLDVKEVKDTTWAGKNCGGCPKAAKCKGADKEHND